MTQSIYPYVVDIEDVVDALREIAPIAQCLKSEQVIFHERANDFPLPRQAAKEIERRERNMQEKGEGALHI